MLCHHFERDQRPCGWPYLEVQGRIDNKWWQLPRASRLAVWPLTQKCGSRKKFYYRVTQIKMWLIETSKGTLIYRIFQILVGIPLGNLGKKKRSKIFFYWITWKQLSSTLKITLWFGSPKSSTLLSISGFVLSTKNSSETLQNLPYFWNTKTHVVDIEQGIH